MSLPAAEAKKEASKGKSSRTTYETVKQGVKQLYPVETSTSSTNIDIVFVPGLGANPEESWKKGDFNWASDKNGIAKDYPNARVLLYLYESAFHGQLKVDQTMDNVAKGLLHALQAKRGDQINRPIVFIGHSMGGLVIAKAVTMMDAQRDTFRKMFEATAGCIFFGSPFNGAEAASVAAMFAWVGEQFNQANKSKLLDLMKPDDANLRELRADFMRLVIKLPTKIELYCFWEEHNTDPAKIASEFIAKREPAMTGGRISNVLYDIFKQARAPFKIVERESATFGGVVENLGLACNHRDLVKFDDFKDPRYQMIRDPLKKIIHGAPLVAKNRLCSTRDIDLKAIKGITEALEGSTISRKRVAQKFTPSSWLPMDKQFSEWLAKDDDPHHSVHKQRGDALWVCGAQGRGKTGATIAALEQIDKVIKDDEHHDSGKAPILMAYYFCDPTSDVSTAEELLKSLLLQLIQKQPLFVPYAKQFTKREKRQAVPTSIENLWQSLQDMLSDDIASSRIYFVINNLHGLPQDSDSTKKLFDLISGEVQAMNDEDIARVSVRWMFTSRKANKRIGDIVNSGLVRLIDLEDEKYANQVQLELRKHAQKKVAMLGSEKGYKKDLAYFVSSLIGNRAQNTGWIDMTCGQLEELPESENPLIVRQTLKRLPQQLDDLLDEGWKQIFESNPSQSEKIKNMLQALALTYEEPTLDELTVLAGWPANGGADELRDLVGRCKSFLLLKGDRVCFKSPIVKPHLVRHADLLLGVTEEEIKWLHGELAWRSFSHLLERFDTGEPEAKEASEGEPGDGAQPEDTTSHAAPSVAEEEHQEARNDDGEEEAHEEEDEEEEEEEEDDESDDGDDADDDSQAMAEPEITALHYMVKHWLHHASKSTAEMAEDLSLQESFWKPGSILRARWLAQYEYLTKQYNNLDYKSLSALHVAASAGFRQLVAALMENGYKDELHLNDSLANQPLHLAAYFGRPNIVEELIYRGAPVDGGKEEKEATPLLMAASMGAVKVMSMLLAAGADPNAMSNDSGSPLNNAIGSGNMEAVKLLVEKGATISPDPSDDFDSPLGCAARLPDAAAFDYLVDVGRNDLRTYDYDNAFASAAWAGNLEVFRKLEQHEHSQEVLQQALDLATSEREWDVVREMLEKYPDLNCDSLFKEAAVGYDDQDDLLEIVWKYTGGSIDSDYLNDALYEATDNEKQSTVNYLLETCKADPNATGDEYGNALTAAAYDGTLDIVRMLLDAGADINSPNGWALQTAAGEGHEEIVKELLDRGADVNARTENENFEPATALQAACESGQVDIVRLLLEKGANPDLGGGPMTYPIIAAARKGEGEIMKLLIEHGAKVDVFGGPDNSTPLINTAGSLPKEYLKVLLDAGADINLADPDGDTALIITAEWADSESVEFLLENGADVKAVSTYRGTALQAAFSSGDRRTLQLLVDHVSEILKGLNPGTEVKTHEDSSAEATAPEGEQGDEETTKRTDAAAPVKLTDGDTAESTHDTAPSQAHEPDAINESTKPSSPYITDDKYVATDTYQVNHGYPTPVPHSEEPNHDPKPERQESYSSQHSDVPQPLRVGYASPPSGYSSQPAYASPPPSNGPPRYNSPPVNTNSSGYAYSGDSGPPSSYPTPPASDSHIPYKSPPTQTPPAAYTSPPAPTSTAYSSPPASNQQPAYASPSHSPPTDNPQRHSSAPNNDAQSGYPTPAGNGVPSRYRMSSGHPAPPSYAALSRKPVPRPDSQPEPSTVNSSLPSYTPQAGYQAPAAYSRHSSYGNLQAQSQSQAQAPYTRQSSYGGPPVSQAGYNPNAPSAHNAYPGAPREAGNFNLQTAYGAQSGYEGEGYGAHDGSVYRGSGYRP